MRSKFAFLFNVQRYKSMHKIIRSMHKIIKSMRKIIKSMREDLKSMRKLSFSSECAKFLKSMRKVNAREFKIDVQGHCSKFRATITRCDLSATILFKLIDSILSLSNLHNNVASLQKNRDDKSHRVIVA